MADKNDLWTVIGGAVVAQAFTAWIALRNLRSGDSKAKRELRLKADGQQFDQEQKLWTELRSLTKEFQDSRKEFLDLRLEMVTIQAENHILRRDSHQQGQEYAARQLITDAEIAKLRSELAETLIRLAATEARLIATEDELEQSRAEVAILRKRSESNRPASGWGEE